MLRLVTFGLFTVLGFFTCASGSINLFSIEQDLELGRQTAQEIRRNPSEFPILSRDRNPQAYAYLQGLTDEIVRQGKVPYANTFPYEVTIIDKDVRNAFATAGGFLYVYTGLIKFLDTEDQLAGVMGHEIAHAAERHVTAQATKQYGIATLLSVISGDNPGTMQQIAASLLSLRFSRGAESEADDRSVDYLCNTEYAANGAAGFFEKSQGAGAPPEFLSTHPNPANRVQNINARAQERNCSTRTTGQEAFRRFQQSL